MATCKDTLELDPLLFERFQKFMNMYEQFQIFLDMLEQLKNFLAFEPHVMSTSSNKSLTSFSKWILDSGATHHMSYLVSQFISLNRNFSISNVAANGDTMPLEGIGSVDTPSVALSDVYYIPSLTMNLASVSKICDFECDVNFSISDCSIYDRKTKEVVRTGHMQGDLYVLDHFRDIHDTASSSVDLSSFLLNCSSSTFYLWHSRLGHVSGSRLPFLASTGALGKLDAHDISDCSGCKLTKFSALPFKNSVSSSKLMLHLIYSHNLTQSELIKIDPFEEPTPVVSPIIPEHVFETILEPTTTTTETLVTIHKAISTEVVCDPLWEVAMAEELAALHQTRTWDLVQLPVDKRAIGSRWYGMDYEETFAPVAKMTTVRTLIAVASSRIRKIFQLDAPRACAGLILFSLYVDDMIITGDDCVGIESLKLELTHRFAMKDLGDLLDRARITDKMVEDIPIDAKAKYTPTDGDPLSDSSLYQTIMGQIWFILQLHILKYLRGTQFQTLLFPSTSALDLRAYCDSNWAGDVVSRKSTTWSSIEAEYRAMIVTSSEIIWLRWLLADMGAHITSPTPLYYDNRSVIQIARKTVFH
ncbi:uncharacterized mitochondrial protein-like protein [Tanacetum coccineum]